MGASAAFSLSQMLVDATANSFRRNDGASAAYQRYGSMYRDTANLQNQAFQDEAAAQDEEAARVADETGTAAYNTARDADDFIKEQALAYSGAGVLPTEGSPVEVMNETRRRAQENVDAITRRGMATSSLLRRKGAQYRNQGRLNLLAGLNDFNSSLIQLQLGENQNRGGGLLATLPTLSKYLVTSPQFKKFFSGFGKAPTAPAGPAQTTSGTILP